MSMESAVTDMLVFVHDLASRADFAVEVLDNVLLLPSYEAITAEQWKDALNDIKNIINTLNSSLKDSVDLNMKFVDLIDDSAKMTET